MKSVRSSRYAIIVSPVPARRCRRSRRRTAGMWVALFLLVPVFAAATWTDDFFADFDQFGLDVAVENALENDVTSREILQLAISDPATFRIAIVIKAVLCAGVQASIVRADALDLGIDLATFDVAFWEAQAECGIVPVQLQSFTVG